MNVFILGTGRCGTTTLIKACKHIQNYTSGHETAHGNIAVQRFPYPENHIEADNRLSWLLGWLEEEYGNDAFYVHLIRDRKKTAESFLKRIHMGIIKAYKNEILCNAGQTYDNMEICLDYVDTVNKNIEFFLRDKKKKMIFELEEYERDFPKLWSKVAATGDLDNGLREFSFEYNASKNLAYLNRSNAQKLRSALNKSMLAIFSQIR